MLARIERYADNAGTIVLPSGINEIVNLYCQRNNLIHLESGQIKTDDLPMNHDLIYIKTYQRTIKGFAYNSFLCIPIFNLPEIGFIKVAEISNNFMVINMEFHKNEHIIIMKIIDFIHSYPAITLSQHMLN